MGMAKDSDSGSSGDDITEESQDENRVCVWEREKIWANYTVRN